MDTELDNYLDKFEKARLSEDINQQFYWLNQAIDNLFHASNVKDLTRYLSWMLDLARKNSRLDEEMLAMIGFRNLAKVMHDDQEGLIWSEQIHDIGVKIKAIKETENIRFRHLQRGEEALKVIDVFLSQNEAILQTLKMQMG